MDIAPLQKAFETGYGQQQAAVDQIATSLKSEDYAGALTQLRQLAKTAKLTPEQQQAVKDVIEKVQQVIADAAAKASGQANKAAGDLQKALPK